MASVPLLVKKVRWRPLVSASFLASGPWIFVVVQIRGVDEQRGLFADDLDDARMRVTQRVHSDAGDEIEIAGAVRIVNVAAFAPMHDQGIAAVILKQVLALQFDYIVGNGCGCG